jgi:hypothetical protein
MSLNFFAQRNIIMFKILHRFCFNFLIKNCHFQKNFQVFHKIFEATLENCKKMKLEENSKLQNRN